MYGSPEGLLNLLTLNPLLHRLPRDGLLEVGQIHHSSVQLMLIQLGTLFHVTTFPPSAALEE